MEALELALTTARGVHVAASLSTFGAVMFWSAVAPPVLRQADGATASDIEARLLRLFRVSLSVALASALAWLMIDTANIAEAGTASQTAQAIWPVLTDTRFGHVLGLRTTLLVASALALGTGAAAGRRANATGLAGVSLMFHGWQAHAGTLGVTVLGAEALHLLAAGAWLGSLLPLQMLIRASSPPQAALAARSFTPLGLLCVAILAATALLQGWILVGGLAGLVGTDYGLVASAKLALFLDLLGIAAANRFCYTPGLTLAGAPDAKRQLQRSIGVEAAIGLAVILAAASLAARIPAVHEQPVWPFTWRPSLENLNDPDLGPEAISGLIGLAAALVLICVGLIWRKSFVAALAFAVVVVIWVAPNLDLLFVQAYPTSFFHSPTGFAAATIARGAQVFSSQCVACHGATGSGDGPAAKSLPVPPADLTAAHLWAHRDGELFWWISHGIETAQGPLAMPGFADRLSEDDRWALIDYVRANNAGTSMAASGQWQDSVLAPDFSANCTGGRVITLANLRGQVVQVLASVSGDVPPALPQVSKPLTTIRIDRDGQTTPTARTCVAADPSVWTAYAVVSGEDADSLDGTRFLVDSEGWLRARWRPGDPASWADPGALQAEIEKILSNPLTAETEHSHVHGR
jgi:putative copper export protein/mono/diheme cytochrome c family protein